MRLERWNPRSGSVMEWDQFTPVAGLSRLMDEVFGTSPFGDAVAEGRWSPKVDVYEKDDAFVVKAEVPGVKAEEVTANTGFPVPVPAEIKVTATPTAEELRLLREEIDPNGLRDLESLGTRERLVRLAQVLRAER